MRWVSETNGASTASRAASCLQVHSYTLECNFKFFRIRSNRRPQLAIDRIEHGAQCKAAATRSLCHRIASQSTVRADRLDFQNIDLRSHMPNSIVKPLCIFSLSQTSSAPRQTCACQKKAASRPRRILHQARHHRLARPRQIESIRP